MNLTSLLFPPNRHATTSAVWSKVLSLALGSALPFVFHCHVASKLLYGTCEYPPPDIASWGLFPQEVLRAVCGGPDAPPEEAVEMDRIALELEFCIPPVAVPGGTELLRALADRCSGRPSALAWLVGFAQRTCIQIKENSTCK
jgi:hypothetical protein